MKPIAIMRMRPPSASHLDTQTVTTGVSGSAPLQDRLRGFISDTIGSISDGTSDIFGPGNAVTALCWDENGGSGMKYVLTITGATDSGWSTLTIGSKVLTRTARTTFGGGTWTWVDTDIVSNQAFGGNGNVVPCYFD